MSRFVLDCSVTMAWCFEDETHPFADAVLDRLAGAEAVVPSIWPLEVANVLLVAKRRKRLTYAESARFIELLRGLPIAVDPEAPARAFDQVLAIAGQHRLSSCDAVYLELAMREGLALATLDDHLSKAAAKLSVKVLAD